jgi:hypothetical protein
MSKKVNGPTRVCIKENSIDGSTKTSKESQSNMMKIIGTVERNLHKSNKINKKVNEIK